MRNLESRRFGVREVTKGKFKGGLHVAPESYNKFFSELAYLHVYLYRRVVPAEPEEALMRDILLDLQNILEHEAEHLIKHHVRHNRTKKNQEFKKNMEAGFVSFKSKFEWLHRETLITNAERDVLEEIRRLRNDHVHARPTTKRPRHKYFGKPLLTAASLKAMFVHVETVFRKMRKQSGSKGGWPIIPPGYASEMKWSTPDMQGLENQVPP